MKKHIIVFLWGPLFLFPLLTGCRQQGPEYREPPLGAPHGTILVKPLVEGRGGGLRSIDGLRVFHPRAFQEEINRSNKTREEDR
ncbi:MAG: hypothetical protein ACYTHM_08995 [Planctomycetota bacterium]|jgi:hypothetical protein